MRNAILVLALSLVVPTACSSSSSNSEPSQSGGSAGASGHAGSGGTAPVTGGAAGASGAPAGNGGADAGCVDCPDDDSGTAGASGQAGSAGTGGSSPSGDVGIYGVCSTPTECEVGLTCVTVVNEPEYGQCTHDCVDDSDCAPSPSGNQVACHPQAKICLSLCGVHGGECPDGLVCTAHEVCLEPSGVEATKGPGEHCSGTAECLGEAECVEGENTSAYCAPLCDTNEDCSVAAPGHSGQCMNVSGVFSFCMFFCGMMAGGATCPGDLVCEGNTICR